MKNECYRSKQLNTYNRVMKFIENVNPNIVTVLMGVKTSHLQNKSHSSVNYPDLESSIPLIRSR